MECSSSSSQGLVVVGLGPVLGSQQDGVLIVYPPDPHDDDDNSEALVTVN